MKKWYRTFAKSAIGKAIRSRVKRIHALLSDLGHKQIGLLAAGIAFYGILAFFPLMVALVAISSIFVKPEDIMQASTIMTQVLPQDLANLVTTQLKNAEGHHLDNVIAATVAIVVSIISVAGATGSLMGALNVMYGFRETRSFVRQKATSLVLTLGSIVLMLVIVVLLFVGRGLLAQVGFDGFALQLVNYGRWALLILVMMVGLSVLYHSGPSRPEYEKWKWITQGAIITTLLWVLVSVLFFWYLGNIANFTRAYSLFAGIIGMMLWLALTAYVVLFGAEINARHERSHKG